MESVPVNNLVSNASISVQEERHARGMHPYSVATRPTSHSSPSTGHPKRAPRRCPPSAILGHLAGPTNPPSTLPVHARPFLCASLATLALSVACASGSGSRETASRPASVAPPETRPAPKGDGMPTGFASAFAAADARARAVVYWQQCSATVLRLRAAGAFGAVARAPRSVHCERTDDGVPVGGVFDIDTGYTKARRVTLVR